MTTIVDRMRMYYHEHPEAADTLAPSAPLHVVEAAETKLGFALPPLLRELYLTLGNGGFADGVIGLAFGMADYSGMFLPELYLSIRKDDPEDPAQYWPEQLVPFSECGCGSYSCVDCSKEEAPVIGFDPNVYNPNEGTTWSETFILQAESLEEWLDDWLANSG